MYTTSWLHKQNNPKPWTVY